jgi:two-component system sensor histidine kinase BarA
MKKLGIKYQLRLTTLIPVLIAALLFAFFYNTELRKDSDHQISKLGEGYIRQTLPAAQSALMKNDRKALQGLANDSIVNPEIKSLAFYDAKGHLIAYRGGKHPINTAFKAPDYVGDYIEKKRIQPYLINFVTPITISKLKENSVDLQEKNKKPLPVEDILGWASLDMDTQSIHILQYQMIILSIVISLIVLLISLLVDYLFSRQIYLPIARLRRSMKQILRNEFETQISATSEGELGDIEKGCVNLQKHFLNATKE